MMKSVSLGPGCCLLPSLGPGQENMRPGSHRERHENFASRRKPHLMGTRPWMFVRIGYVASV